jgi:hypothetical protein
LYQGINTGCDQFRNLSESNVIYMVVKLRYPFAEHSEDIRRESPLKVEHIRVGWHEPNENSAPKICNQSQIKSVQSGCLSAIALSAHLVALAVSTGKPESRKSVQEFVAVIMAPGFEKTSYLG